MINWGYSYLDMIQDELDDELDTFRELKRKRLRYDCCIGYNTADITFKN